MFDLTFGVIAVCIYAMIGMLPVAAIWLVTLQEWAGGWYLLGGYLTMLVVVVYYLERYNAPIHDLFGSSRLIRRKQYQPVELTLGKALWLPAAWVVPVGVFDWLVSSGRDWRSWPLLGCQYLVMSIAVYCCYRKYGYFYELVRKDYRQRRAALSERPEIDE